MDLSELMRAAAELDERPAGAAPAPGPRPAGSPSDQIWRAGRRRRARAQVSAVLAAAACVALVVAWALSDLSLGLGLRESLGTPAVTRGSASYPQRVDGTAQPLRPGHGPMAGLVEGGSQDGAQAWVFDGTGTVYALPEQAPYPVLSPDGRRVAYQSADTGLVVLDLTTLTRWQVAGLGVPEGDVPSGPVSGTSSYVVDPGYAWSPDSRQIAVGAVRAEPGSQTRALLVVDVTARALRAIPGSPGLVFGWRDGTHVVTATGLDDSGAGAPTLRSVDVATGAGRDLLDLSRYGGTTAARIGISPDGSRAAFATTGDLPLPVVDLANGSTAAVFSDAAFRYWNGNCGLTWRQGLPYGTFDGRLLPVGGTDDPLLVVHPGFAARCVQLTSTAADGEPLRSPFGTNTGWFAWYPWQTSLVLAGLLAGVVGLVARVRRAGRQR